MSYTLSVRNKNKALMLRNLTSEQIQLILNNKPRIKKEKKVTWEKGIISPKPSRVRYHKYLINKP